MGLACLPWLMWKTGRKSRGRGGKHKHKQKQTVTQGTLLSSSDRMRQTRDVIIDLTTNDGESSVPRVHRRMGVPDQKKCRSRDRYTGENLKRKIKEETVQTDACIHQKKLRETEGVQEGSRGGVTRPLLHVDMFKHGDRDHSGQIHCNHEKIHKERRPGSRSRDRELQETDAHTDQGSEWHARSHGQSRHGDVATGGDTEHKHPGSDTGGHSGEHSGEGGARAGDAKGGGPTGGGVTHQGSQSSAPEVAEGQVRGVDGQSVQVRKDEGHDAVQEVHPGSAGSLHGGHRGEDVGILPELHHVGHGGDREGDALLLVHDPEGADGQGSSHGTHPETQEVILSGAAIAAQETHSAVSHILEHSSENVNQTASTATEAAESTQVPSASSLYALCMNACINKDTLDADKDKCVAVVNEGGSPEGGSPVGGSQTQSVSGTPVSGHSASTGMSPTDDVNLEGGTPLEEDVTSSGIFEEEELDGLSELEDLSEINFDLLDSILDMEEESTSPTAGPYLTQAQTSAATVSQAEPRGHHATLQVRGQGAQEGSGSGEGDVVPGVNHTTKTPITNSALHFHSHNTKRKTKKSHKHSSSYLSSGFRGPLGFRSGLGSNSKKFPLKCLNDTPSSDENSDEEALPTLAELLGTSSCSSEATRRGGGDRQDRDPPPPPPPASSSVTMVTEPTQSETKDHSVNGGSVKEEPKNGDVESVTKKSPPTDSTPALRKKSDDGPIVIDSDDDGVDEDEEDDYGDDEDEDDELEDGEIMSRGSSPLGDQVRSPESLPAQSAVDKVHEDDDVVITGGTPPTTPPVTSSEVPAPSASVGPTDQAPPHRTRPCRPPLVKSGPTRPAAPRKGDRRARKHSSSSSSSSSSGSGSSSSSSSSSSDSDSDSDSSSRSSSSDTSGVSKRGGKSSPAPPRTESEGGATSAPGDGGRPHYAQKRPKFSAAEKVMRIQSSGKVQKKSSRVFTSGSDDDSEEESNTNLETETPHNPPAPKPTRRKGLRYVKIPRFLTDTGNNMLRSLRKHIRRPEDVANSMMVVACSSRKLLDDLRANLVDVKNVQVSRPYTFDVGPPKEIEEREISDFQPNVIFPLPTNPNPQRGYHHLLYHMTVCCATPLEWMMVGRYIVDCSVKNADTMTVNFAMGSNPAVAQGLYNTNVNFSRRVRQSNTTDSVFDVDAGEGTSKNSSHAKN
ncbi:protein EE1 [Proboscivirus elephantidbeta5]|uniref:Protein EE1 n=1 Tax=Elephant endotheliotropic herpesvirus 5 TaxID=768738 RepID=A0A075CXP5_9BETA|nr:protein EE1 [Elephant endotheliotropic herpesvirus 5]AHC02761.1 protein EE1 [Elephant endotheliotropic herpesvirus 5]